MNDSIFIAMPFNSDFDIVYQDAIVPAVVKFGLVPYRVDELTVDSRIIQDIEQGIEKSILVIADLTGRNPNVFYEVGYARAVGKNIISSTQKHDDVTFDLKDRRYIFYTNNSLGILKFKNELIQWITEILKNQKSSPTAKVFVHGTKFDVPNKNEFWNDLCARANNRFYLLGGSNKSWINKSDEQSEQLATAIFRIVSNNGKVKIISNSLTETVQSHREFFKKNLQPKIKSKVLQDKFKHSFIYGVVEHSNYKAVISDDRILLLPTMNSKEFNNESLVMELEGSHLPYFKNYLADIERLFKENKCKVIDLSSDEKFL